MAENDLRDDERDEDNDNAQKPPVATPWYKRWWLWLLLALLLVAVGVGVTLFALDSSTPPGDVTEEGEAAADSSAQSQASALYYPLKPEFITNYSVQGRQRSIKVDMTLMLRDNSVVPALELHMPALRHSINMLLVGQVYEELQTAEGKELLRQHALVAVQEVLETEIGVPGVEQVLFTNFVMQ